MTSPTDTKALRELLKGETSGLYVATHERVVDALPSLLTEVEELREALEALHDSYVKVCPYANLVAQQARAALSRGKR